MLKVRFGQFLVDQEHNLLVGDDGEQQVPPLLMDVLCHLVSHRDRVVSSDELLSEFWTDRVVEDSTIHRRINQIRTMLGDSARSPRYIRTVSKKGYQAIADVVPVQEANTGTEDEAIGSSTGSATAVRRLLMVAATLLVAAAGVTFWLKSGPQQEASQAPDTVSIAILPFVSLSADSENARFSEGIHDDITTTLARVSAINVRSRMSVLRYQESEQSPAEIARELNVDYVLEASVRRQQDKVRLNMKLIDARSESSVWVHSVDKDLDDVFRVQQEIAEAVARGLAVRFSEADQVRLTNLPRTSAQVYDLYQQARALLLKEEKPELELARELLATAIAMDPEYAPLYATRLEVLMMAARTYLHWSDVREEAISTSDRALTLDPESALSHLARAMMLLSFERSPIEGMWHFRRAAELDPHDSHILSLLGERLGGERGLELLARAREYDPYSTESYMRTAFVLQGLGRFDEAQQIIDQGMRFAPDDNMLKSALVWNLTAHSGEYFRALELVRGLNLNNVDLLFFLCEMFLILEDETALTIWYDALARLAPDSYHFHFISQLRAMSVQDTATLRRLSGLGLRNDIPLTSTVWLHAQAAANGGEESQVRTEHLAIVELLSPKFDEKELIPARAELALQYATSLTWLGDPRAESVLQKLARLDIGNTYSYLFLVKAKALAMQADVEGALSMLESHRHLKTRQWEMDAIVRDSRGLFNGLGETPRFASFHRHVRDRQERLKHRIRTELPVYSRAPDGL